MCFRRQFLCKNEPFQLSFLLFIVCRISFSCLTLCNILSFLTGCVQLIFSILLQHYISQFSRHFWSTFQSVQVSASCKSIRLTQILKSPTVGSKTTSVLVIIPVRALTAGGVHCWLSGQEVGLVTCGLEGRPGMIHAWKLSPGSVS
jgi:hypothetical protein